MSPSGLYPLDPLLLKHPYHCDHCDNKLFTVRQYRGHYGGGESDWLLRTPSAANQILSTIVALFYPYFDLLPN